MLFRQVIEPDSSTYTYLLHCPDSGKTALIDPVLDTVERDLKMLNELGLELDFTLDTHVHADHLTGAKRLKELTGSQIVGPAIDQLPCTDIGVREGELFRLGNIEIHPLYTPGHTDHHHAYLIDNGTQKMLFSGDALLIEACGRTDFQSGDAATLYRSIHDKFFTLPDETLVYPCHDYEGRFVTTIAQEKIRNPRLGSNKSLEEFVEMMDNMELPYPRKIDFAVPGNELCGACPENVPDKYRAPCDRHDQG
ncbi:MBL fold metallo-hydrolase [Thiohalophilus sp.]|uniref:MBL fold metallo-hydrolase n=1 Tax=Thiohalophilus sp. TaxID=3028392 RepID=UPI0039770BDF